MSCSDLFPYLGVIPLLSVPFRTARTYTYTATLKKILIIEDDVDTIELVEAILNFAGYAVIKVSREISIKEIAGINPSLAILDYLMPYASGNELCLQMKTSPETSHIPVILYSASVYGSKIAEDCKADAFVAKPFDLDSLLELVNRLAL